MWEKGWVVGGMAFSERRRGVGGGLLIMTVLSPPTSDFAIDLMLPLGKKMGKAAVSTDCSS